MNANQMIANYEIKSAKFTVANSVSANSMSANSMSANYKPFHCQNYIYHFRYANISSLNGDLITTEILSLHRGRPQRHSLSPLEKVPFQPKFRQPPFLFRPHSHFFQQVFRGLCSTSQTGPGLESVPRRHAAFDILSH